MCRHRQIPPPPANSGHSASALELIPARLDVGEPPPGRGASGRFAVWNRGAMPVSVARIDVSCPCVRINPGSFVVGPGGTTELEVEFDPRDEPKFRGALAVSVDGRSASNDCVFRGIVDVTVIGDAHGKRSQHARPN
jgi:hypothetical protein